MFNTTAIIKRLMISQSSNKLRSEFEEEKVPSDESAKLKQFPKKVAIVFAEKLPNKKLLNFDQAACAHLLLQTVCWQYRFATT
jgi:hypothetical protein